MCSGIFLNHMNFRRIGFVLGRIFGVEEETAQLPIILDVGIDGSGNTIWIEAICFRFIELLIPGVVYKKDIGYGRTPNCSTIHGTCLIFGAGDVAVFCGVKVTNRVKGEP